MQKDRKHENQYLIVNLQGVCRSYLLNGMCSKGPLVGIVPQRSLFETSLEACTHRMKLLPCKEKHAIQQIDNRKLKDLHHFEVRDFCQFPWNWTSQAVIIKSPTM